MESERRVGRGTTRPSPARKVPGGSCSFSREVVAGLTRPAQQNLLLLGWSHQTGPTEPLLSEAAGGAEQRPHVEELNIKATQRTEVHEQTPEGLHTPPHHLTP